MELWLWRTPLLGRSSYHFRDTVSIKQYEVIEQESCLAPHFWGQTLEIVSLNGVTTLLVFASTKNGNDLFFFFFSVERGVMRHQRSTFINRFDFDQLN